MTRCHVSLRFGHVSDGAVTTDWWGPRNLEIDEETTLVEVGFGPTSVVQVGVFGVIY